MMITNKVRMAALTAMTALLFTVGSMPAVAYDRSTYAESSKLATGTWVKISVTESGMHEITADDASSWGLGSLDGVRVFGYGGAMLPENISPDMRDDLPQIPTVRVGNRLIFYAQGPVQWNEDGVKGLSFVQYHNPYSNVGYYFVTNDSRYDDLKAGTSAVAVGATAPVTTFTERTYHEVDLVNAGQTGRVYLGEDFRTNSRQTFNFDLKGLVDGSTVTVRTVFCAKLMNATSQINLAYNGTALPTASDDNIAKCTSSNHDHFRFCTSTKNFELTGTSSLAYTVSYPTGGNALTARLDYITVNYERRLALEDGQLAFGTFDDVASLQVSGCHDGTSHVWDVTDVAAPVEMNAQAGGGTLTFSPVASGRREYVAWDESGSFARPALVGRVTNQDLHAQPTPDMIILSPTEYLSQAERVASMHESRDGMRVLVVDHNKVFNEFSSGTPDFMAYRKLCKMFYDRGSDGEHRLGYLLLLGGGSYDNRLITSGVRDVMGPMLLTWQSETSQREETSYTTDDWLGVLADDSSDAYYRYDLDIAVGRLVARNVTDMRTMVDKLIKYATQADYGTWKTGVVDLADDGDAAEHMVQAQRLIDESRAAGGDAMVHNYVFIDAFNAESQGAGRYYPDARSKFYNTLSEGVLWWTYVGHAGPTSLTAEAMVRNEDVQSRFYYRHLPVLYAATCEFTRFDANAESSGETLLLNANGGVIASICPARLVYVNQNGELTRHIGKVMFSRDEQGRPLRLGDIVRKSKNALRAELESHRSSSDNHSRFILYGDPALRPALPELKATVATYNGQVVDATNKPTFEARQTIAVTGNITDIDGTAMTSFNGRIIATLRDSEQSITTNGYGSDGAEFTFLDRPNKLAVVTDTVRGGAFSLKITIPTEIYDNFSPAQLNLYAYDDHNQVEAMGRDDNFYIYGLDEDAVVDTDGPEINYFGLNGGSFNDGDNVNESPLVIAQVSDASGISFSTSGVGHNMTLTLDEKTTYSDLPIYYTPSYVSEGSAGTINYPLSDLAYGPHTLRLRVWDVFNNASEKTISFNVMQGLKPSIVDVYAVGNPASTEARFYVTHNRPDAVMTVTVEVYDMMGRRLWSNTQTGRSDMFTTSPVTWNLTDYTGSRVQRGIYIYRATITTDGVREASKAKRIAVTGQ